MSQSVIARKALRNTVPPQTMSPKRILGLHHMTAICGPSQENVDFYCGVLGLRLVKLTVNFDDPTAYHLYYGDAKGSPGTILTFFPYPDGYPGRTGTGQATVTTLCIPPGSLRYWTERLRANSVDIEATRGRTIEFMAPDGLKLRLVADPTHEPGAVWENSPVPGEHAIGAMRAITIEEEVAWPTKKLLTELLEMVEVDENTLGFEGSPGRIEILERPTGPHSRGGRGSVHHIAFRTPTDETQLEMRERLLQSGYHVSPVMNRDYFKSIYFREPGGVLFEIATDPPGFSVDEPEESLGSSLRLPAQYEPARAQIEKALGELKIP
jgi:glyoxalase family protein